MNCSESFSSFNFEESEDEMTLVRLLLLFFILKCAFPVESAKILGIFPTLAKSHYLLGKALIEELVNRGHEVTMISPFVDLKETKPSYRKIKLDYEKDIPKEDKEDDFFTNIMSSPITLSFFLNHAGGSIADFVFSDQEILKLLNSDEKFDAVIMDKFITDSFAYFHHHFNATNILLSSTATNAQTNAFVGNPAPPSSVSDFFLGITNEMNFIERLKNTFLYLYGRIYNHCFSLQKQAAVLKEKIPNAPPLFDFLYNVSLVLQNGHESYSDAVPIVPVMKNIGGFHVKKPKKLPDDSQKFMDDAKDGVIYFSMGSYLKSKHFPIDIRNAILRVFSKLKAKILWKWEDEVLPGQPENVKLQKWFPQQDVLAHPNLKLFITHGGLLSSIEAIYHGVPLLSIPVFGDQAANAHSATLKGYALDIPYLEFEEKKFEDALNDLLNNPKYKENAVLRSNIFHDRPMEPLDEAVYWVEYVIRHKGAEHLRVAALKLSWYQYLLLDVAAFLLAILGIVVFTIRFTIRKFLRKKKCTKKVKTK